MERSRADRILGDWDRISRQRRRPGLPSRSVVTTPVPARTVTGAALLVVVVVAAGFWFGLPHARGPAGPAPSRSPVAVSASPGGVSASPATTWGPLAVVPPEGGADTARTEGTLRITDACVSLESGESVTLLLWPADRTTWSGGPRTITFENFDGTAVTVGDGEEIVLGGSGDTAAEAGISGADLVAGMAWVAPPATSCPLDAWWFVGAVERASAAEAPASTAPFIAEAGGLKLVAAFDRMEVEAGDRIEVALSIENKRSTDVAFAEPCDTQAMTVDLLVPLEPIGRDWDGIAAAFKTYALEQSSGSPMESSIRTPVRTLAAMEPCHAVTPGIIEAGTTYETTLTWTAELQRGVPALPGPAPFSIQVLYDQEAVGQLVKAETIEATGTITVLAGARSAISAGEALDAALGDAEFMAWLSGQPQDSWVNTNLFLAPAAVGVDQLPSVPYWDIELYHEPRSWAILHVDAMTGEVAGRLFCDVPCDR